jgi:hypothetical protein
MANALKAPRAMGRVMGFVAGGGAPLSPIIDLLCTAAMICPPLDRLIPVR